MASEGVATLLGQAKSLPYVRSCTIFGTSLHLLVDAKASNETIERDLESFGVASVKVSEIEPSLEDVFVQLTETRGKEVEASRAEVLA